MQKKRLIYPTSKLTQIMRISCLLWCFLITGSIVLASFKSYGQKELENTIRVNFENTSLKDVLEQLQVKHFVPLAYDGEAEYLTSKVNYKANKKIRFILKDLLEQQNLTYELRHNFVRIIKNPIPKKLKQQDAI